MLMYHNVPLRVLMSILDEVTAIDEDFEERNPKRSGRETFNVHLQGDILEVIASGETVLLVYLRKKEIAKAKKLLKPYANLS